MIITGLEKVSDVNRILNFLIDHTDIIWAGGKAITLPDDGLVGSYLTIEDNQLKYYYPKTKEALKDRGVVYTNYKDYILSYKSITK